MMQHQLFPNLDDSDCAGGGRQVGVVRPRIRYIGSKARFADTLLDLIGPPKYSEQRFIDLFCGGGAVSRAAAKHGWPVHLNDNLESSVCITKAQLLSVEDLDFNRVGGYSQIIKQLNATSAKFGPIYREYAPSGMSRSGNSRKYFTKENAAKIDGIREMIEELFTAGRIGKNERLLLVTDLISAANSVANIAGTYGCFLSRWTTPALSEIQLSPRSIPSKLPTSSHSVQDAFELVDREDDVLYCDPPYTKRQYAAYYHLLETLALGDYPEVSGVAGIRAWKHKASPFCYKRRAVDAFTKLIRSKNAKRVYVSYSSQGHVPLQSLSSTLTKFGSVKVHTVREVGRYSPNEVSRTNGTPVTEYLLELARQR